MHATCFKLSVQGCKHVLTETLVRASKSSLKTQSCSEDLRKIQTELRNAHFVRTLELFLQNAPSKMCVRVPNKFLLLFSSLLALKEKCWQNMVKNDATYLSTLSQLSAIQKKFDQQKRNSEFLSFKPKKTLLYQACTTLSYVRKITQAKRFQQQLQKQQNINMFLITAKKSKS